MQRDILLNIIMLLTTLACAQTNDNPVQEKVEAFFKEHYQNPVIERKAVDEFPKLSFYSVYEKNNIAEDPLIPDEWVVTGEDKIFPVYDLEKALLSANISPTNEEEALKYAQALIANKYGIAYSVTEEYSYQDIIPHRYLKEKYLPKTSYQDGSYIVEVCFYHHDNPYAHTYSVYKNKLIKYSVTVQQAHYSLSETEMSTIDMDGIDAKLNWLIIDQICNKHLMQSLQPYYEKRNLYGLVDPPSADIAQAHRKELDELWNKGFSPFAKKIHSELKANLKSNPEFQFDVDAIFEATRECEAVKDMEYYDSILNHILSDIISRFVP